MENVNDQAKVDEMYHCCRFCHWYKGERCYHQELAAMAEITSNFVERGSMLIYNPDTFYCCHWE